MANTLSHTYLNLDNILNLHVLNSKLLSKASNHCYRTAWFRKLLNSFYCWSKDHLSISLLKKKALLGTGLLLINSSAFLVCTCWVGLWNYKFCCSLAQFTVQYQKRISLHPKEIVPRACSLGKKLLHFSFSKMNLLFQFRNLWFFLQCNLVGNFIITLNRSQK